MAKKGQQHKPVPEHMPLIHLHAAGIDVGAEAHWVGVPADRVALCPASARRLVNGLSDDSRRDGIHWGGRDAALAKPRGPRL